MERPFHRRHRTEESKLVTNRFFVLFSFLITFVTHAATLAQPVVFTETCDASAGVSVSADLFAVANDEDNLLRFYRWSQPGKPVHTANLNLLLFGKKKSPEMDIEAAARIGQRVFWITSHGRNAKGEFAPDRARLFALEITDTNGEIIVRCVLGSYTNLIDDLAREPKFARFYLADAAKLAPKKNGGLNIESLAATADEALLIGFRNPIPEGRALIVPLLNPSEVLSNRPPHFGDPMTLDLGGLGLRGMETIGSGYYLIAGPAHGSASSHVFFWKGDSSAPRLISGIDFAGLNPEGICLMNTTNQPEFLLFSDDGSREVGGKECKDLPRSERHFRACRLSP